jgi:predicted nucleic acid-binding protein
MSRVFIDSNILLYAVDNRESNKRNKARQIIRRLIKKKEGVVSTQVVKEFYVIATKKLKIPPLVVRRVLEHFEHLEILSVDLGQIMQAVDCSILSQISFWDALIVVCAKEANCSILYSEDLGHMQLLRGVRIVNPFIGNAD